MNIDFKREALFTPAHFLTSQGFKGTYQFSTECISARMIENISTFTLAPS